MRDEPQAPMDPAAVYPLPEYTQLTFALLTMIILMGVPVYLLAFRPLDGRRTWGFAEIVAVAILFLLTLPLGAQALGIDAPLDLLELSIYTVAQNGLFVGVPMYVVAVRYRQSLTSLGLRAAGWPVLAPLGAVIGAASILMSAGAESLSVYLIGLVEGPAQAAARAAAEHLDDPLAPLLDQITGGLPALWILILLAVIVPVGEEMFFRGMVYGGLRDRWGATIAVVVSAAAFAAVHVQLVHALPIFMLGVLLALLYERTGSLVPSIATHAVNNIIAVVSVWRGWGF